MARTCQRKGAKAPGWSDAGRTVHRLFNPRKNFWFVGYTPQITTAVWMGYAEGGATPKGLLNLGNQYVGPIEPPAVIRREYIRSVLEGEPVEEFEGVDTSRYDPLPPPPDQLGSTVPGANATTPSLTAQQKALNSNAASSDRAGVWAELIRWGRRAPGNAREAPYHG